MLDRPVHRELDKLLAALCDGCISDQQVVELNRRLAADPVARAAYLAYIDLHINLTSDRRVVFSMRDVDHPRHGGAVTHAPSETDRRRLVAAPARLLVAFAMAALVVLAVTAWILFLPSSERRSVNPVPSTPPASVAVLTKIDNADFVNTDAPMRLGDSIAPGPIRLAAGQVQFMFGSTAVVDLTGPCEFQMTGPNRGRLIAGSLQAYVPDRAHGFTIDLPGEAKIVDLGTEFTAHVDALNITHLRVLTGSVAVTYTDAVEPALLLGVGRAASIHPGGLVSVTSKSQPAGSFSVATDDLVNADQSTLAGVEADVRAESMSFPLSQVMGIRFANNGATDYTGSPGISSGSFAVADGGSVTFTLNTSLHPGGFDLSEIRVLSGYPSSRVSHNFDVAVAYVGDDDEFVPLASVRNGNDLGHGRHRVEVRTRIKRNTDVPLASRVSGIRFTMHNDAPARTGETIYREIDVFGSPGDTETTRGRPVPAPSVAPTP